MAPMDRTRLTGLILMIAAAFQALWFLLCVQRRCYAAGAITASAITLTAAVLLFWIGWTTFELEDDLEGLNFVPEPLDDI